MGLIEPQCLTGVIKGLIANQGLWWPTKDLVSPLHSFQHICANFPFFLSFIPPSLAQNPPASFQSLAEIFLKASQPRDHVPLLLQNIPHPTSIRELTNRKKNKNKKTSPCRQTSSHLRHFGETIKTEQIDVFLL